MTKIKKAAVFITLVAFPSILFAADPPANDFAIFLGTFKEILMKLVPIIVSIAVVVFLVGVTKFIRSADQPQEREQGRHLIVYGIVTLFVMLSMWGLVAFIVNTFFGNVTDYELKNSDVPVLTQ
ncbi:MAG: hypothetical protein KAR24_00435 [Candidatus Pacebacteria bacterium]|nr:hypothetical protein [Candidatus Paceibacterota bacterium]